MSQSLSTSLSRLQATSMSNLCSTTFLGPPLLSPPVQAFKHISALPCFQSVPKPFKIYYELLHMLFKPCKLQLLPNSPLVSGLALSPPGVTSGSSNTWPFCQGSLPGLTSSGSLRFTLPFLAEAFPDLIRADPPTQCHPSICAFLLAEPGWSTFLCAPEAPPRSELTHGSKIPDPVTICWVSDYRDFPLIFSFASYFTLLIQLDVILVYGTRWGWDG